MKEGWIQKSLDELCDKYNGLWKGKKPPFVKVGVIRNANFTKDFKLCFDNIEYLDVEERQYSKRKLQKGDLIVEKSGGSDKQPVGRAVLFLKEDGEYSFSNFTSVLRVKDDKELSYEFLFNYLLYVYNRGDMRSMQKATTGIHNIELDKYLSIQVPIPPLSEQQRIVEYLDSAFAKIDALKAKAKENLDNAQALFQAALDDMMSPKKGWVENTLGDLSEKMADGPFGSNLKVEHYTSNREVRIIQLSNIGCDGWKESNTKYTTFEHLKSISRSEVEPGDIVIAKMMPAGRAIICPDYESKYVLSSDAVKVKLRQGFNNVFICYYINSSHFRKQVLENVTGSGRVRTSLTKLRDCILYIPPLDKQNLTALELGAFHDIIDKLQSNFNTITAECDALKQSLLKQIFE